MYAAFFPASPSDDAPYGGDCGEDTVKKIEEFYKLVVDSFDKVDLYLNDDILDNKEHYSLNKYDRKHLVDLIDFVELCSDWDTSYSYRNKSYTKGNKNSMTSVSYSLYSKYDNEGYSYFYKYFLMSSIVE